MRHSETYICGQLKTRDHLVRRELSDKLLTTKSDLDTKGGAKHIIIWWPIRWEKSIQRIDAGICCHSMTIVLAVDVA